MLHITLARAFNYLPLPDLFSALRIFEGAHGQSNAFLIAVERADVRAAMFAVLQVDAVVPMPVADK